MTIRRVWPWLLIAWGLATLATSELLRWLESRLEGSGEAVHR